MFNRLQFFGYLLLSLFLLQANRKLSSSIDESHRQFSKNENLIERDLVFKSRGGQVSATSKQSSAIQKSAIGHSSAKKARWKEQLEQLKAGLKVIEDEALAIPGKYGMTHEEMDEMLANPSNFTPENWQLIEEARVRTIKFKEELREALQITSGKSQVPSKERVRKPKAKKNWIPVQ